MEAEPILQLEKILERISSPNIPEPMRGLIRKTFRHSRPTISGDKFAQMIDNLVALRFPETTLEELGTILATLAPEVYQDWPQSARPTNSPPGPDPEPTGRIATYRRRHRRGRSLHHPEDSKIG